MRKVELTFDDLCRQFFVDENRANRCQHDGTTRRAASFEQKLVLLALHKMAIRVDWWPMRVRCATTCTKSPIDYTKNLHNFGVVLKFSPRGRARSRRRRRVRRRRRAFLRASEVDYRYC